MSFFYKKIQSLSRDESRSLKIFLKRTNAESERKDLRLLELAKKKDAKLNENQLIQKLYKQEDKNAFYRLKNRLHTEMDKSLLLHYHNHGPYNKVSNSLNLAQVFKQKQCYEIAYKYLVKAEKVALKNELFDLLDILYSDLIQLASENFHFDPTIYVHKRDENQKKLTTVREIDSILAVLSFRIRTFQHYANSKDTVIQTIEKTIADFGESEMVKNSTSLQFKIYHSISKILLQKQDFISLEIYLSETYERFSSQGWFDKSNHETKVQMLLYLINALFMNEKIAQSLATTKELKAALEEHDRSLYNRYLLFYYNSLVINYQVTDKNKAIQVLEEAKMNASIQAQTNFPIIVYGNLALFYFDEKQYKKARKNIVKLKQHEHFQQLSTSFRLATSIAELIIIFELRDIDLFDYQLKSIYTTFPELSSKRIYNRERQLIQIMQKMDQWDKATIKTEIEAFIEKTSSESARKNELLFYDDWLKSKL